MGHGSLTESTERLVCAMLRTLRGDSVCVTTTVQCDNDGFFPLRSCHPLPTLDTSQAAVSRWSIAQRLIGCTAWQNT